MNKKLIAVALIAFVACVNAALAITYYASPREKADIVLSRGSGAEYINSGHLALFSGATYLLEVRTGRKGINNTCVYNDRKVSDLLTYGGAKYDGSLTSSERRRVLDILERQADSYDARYNLVLGSLKLRTSTKYCYVFGDFGKIVKKQKTGDARLRCDYAVVASYCAKTDAEWASRRWFWFSPRDVFDEVPTRR